MTSTEGPDPFSPAKEDWVEFESIDNVPAFLSGVYLFRDRNRNALYCGQSKAIRMRLKQHQKKKWFKDVGSVAVLAGLPTEDARLTAETIQILLHRPRHNRSVVLGIRKDGSLTALGFLRTGKGPQ